MPYGHPRVLHVEDNSFFASVTAGVLGDEYEIDVQTVETGTAALERLESERFDCIVSDYEMPGMDGLELLDAVRELYADVPFILLTGGGSEQIASKAISAGVTDYLRKGDGEEQFAVLANRIENAVARRRTERLADRQTEVNDLIWDVSQSVLQTASREEIERTVCERLAESNPYLFAWIGKVDDENETICPEMAAGIEKRNLAPVRLDSDCRSGDLAVVREAVRTQSVQTDEPLVLEDDFEIRPDVRSEYYTAAAVPLVYEDRPFGVLSVWSDVRCAFDETERHVLSKFGSNVAYAIDSVQTRKQLVRREQRLQVFNRILRHNLRNDLNVVLGHAENLIEKFPPAETEAKVIERKANELIDISEKAREVGKTLDRDDWLKRQVDVTECVKRTCEEFRQSYPDATIDEDVPETAKAYADKTLEAALGELVENAIEHNDSEGPAVTVRVAFAEDDTNWIEVTVLDDGPGIPEEEREVLVEGKETALHHGSGLGLWLANWIVGKFDGEVRFGDYHTDGGAVTLRLKRAVDDAPRHPDISVQ